jgi:hypothetical protein
MKIRLFSIYFWYYFVVALKPFIVSFWWCKINSNGDLLWNHKFIGTCRGKLAICLSTVPWRRVSERKFWAPYTENCTELEFSLYPYVDDIHVDSILLCTISSAKKINVTHKRSEQVCTMACTWNYSQFIIVISRPQSTEIVIARVWDVVEEFYLETK